MTKKTGKRVAMDKKALRRLMETDLLYLSFGRLAKKLDTHPTNIARAYASGPKAEGVSPALLNAMVAKGYLDQHEVNEVLKVEITPCFVCGNAHPADYCVEELGPVRTRTRPAGSGPRRPRVWMPTNNQKRAIEVIMKHYPNLVIVDGDLILFVPDMMSADER